MTLPCADCGRSPKALEVFQQVSPLPKDKTKDTVLVCKECRAKRNKKKK